MKYFFTVLLSFLISFTSKGQDSLSKEFFLNVNIYTPKSYYTNYLEDKRIASQEQRTVGIFKPSILWKTKKNNYREVELTTLKYTRSDDKLTALPIDTILAGNGKQNYGSIEITYRHHRNFFKKKSTKLIAGFILGSSLRFSVNNYFPYINNTFITKGRTIAFSPILGLGVKYLFDKRLLVGVNSYLVAGGFYYTHTFQDNPAINPQSLRTQNFFQGSLLIRLPPSSFVFSLSYKL